MIDQQVAALFNPRSIALVGATDKSLWSLSTYANLGVHGFPGDVHLVNPKGGLVHGRQSYATIADLPDGVDLAFLMVPTTAVLDVVEQVADRGIGSVVLLTSGFAEVGEEGARLEREVVDLAQRRGVLILGPNGNGYINAAASITPYGLPIASPLLRGPVGVVLQSGALASAVLNFAQARNVGVSLLVSMGNESMVTMTDVMRYLVHDEATRVITLFIESIRHPGEFLDVAEEALAAGKPVVALKVGRSQAGARVAKAHTGSLVGDDAVVDAVFRQHGVIRVDSLEDLLITSGLLAETGPLPGRRIGFVTASGGASEIIADRAEDEGLEIPPFAAETVAGLKEIVPPFASTQNPVDVTGYILVDGSLLARSLRVVQDDPGIDMAVLVSDLPRDEPKDPSRLIDRARRSAEALRSSSKPTVVLGNTLTDITPFGRRVAEEVGYPGVLGGIHHGLTALGRALRWSESYRARTAATPPPRDAPHARISPADASVSHISAGTGEPFTGQWSEHRAAAFLAERGIPVVPQQLVEDADAAADAAERFGYPVVVKLAADDLLHKSDIGGVRLGLGTAAEVRQAYDDVVAAGRSAGGTVLGALVQPQRSGGIELLVGVVTDPVWGHVLAVGLGGIWVEVLRDTALRVLPVTRDDVRTALTELRGAAVLHGARGTEPADLDAVADAITAITGLATDLGDRLESLEINPLLVTGARVEALDALITWH
ncbi:MAG TPA: acetate--CoA ligase family protein [Mycobacteriales bacterium]